MRERVLSAFARESNARITTLPPHHATTVCLEAARGVATFV